MRTLTQYTGELLVDVSSETPQRISGLSTTPSIEKL